MKKLILLSVFAVATVSALAQENIQKAYFHELRGMEDSAGVTHLFYKMNDYYEDEYPCGDGTISYFRRDNNIYHFRTSTGLDSLLFEQYATEYCGGYNYYRIFDYTFVDQNPKKWIKGEVANSQYSILDYEGHMFQFDLPVPTKSVSTTNYKDYFPTGFFLNTEQDSLFIQTDYNAGTLKFPAKGNDWPQFQNHETYAAYTDSVAINWDIIAQHPSLDSLYFARAENQNGLYRSEQSLQNFTQVDTNSFSSSLKFDSDSSHIYSLGKNGIFKSSELGAHSTWSLIEIGFETNSPKFLTIDDQIPGRLFISDSTLILNSDDFGNSFTELIFVDDQITGLYKKPDSDLLYVLTTEELLEVNTETQETTTLKQLPVSSEPEPKEIPNQITLEQNYPNPFNPTTVISYQLAVNSLVNLEVFDVMGRKVAVLVDGERKSAGSHQVTFDASGLSSGMYFYRLQSAGQTFTQKMMLVK